MFLDHITLACQALGGVLGALLAAAIFRSLSLGAIGTALTGVVGGALGGLIFNSYFALEPASRPGVLLGEPEAILAHLASGAAGGAILLIVIGFLKTRVAPS